MLSLANVSQQQGKTYYKKDNYYSKEQSKEYSQWFGIAAKELGLEGDVGHTEFENLLFGKSPDGKQVWAQDVRRNLSEKRQNAFDSIFLAAMDRVRASEPDKIRLTKLAKDIIGNKSLTKNEIRQGVDKLIELASTIKKTNILLSPKEQDGLFIKEEGLTKKELSSLKRDFKEALKDLAEPEKKDQIKLTDKRADELKDSLRKVMAERQLPLSLYDVVIEEVMQRLDGKRATAQKLRVINAAIGKIVDAAELPKEGKILARKELKEALNKAKAAPERRAACDLTFSAPKSLSMQALIYDDQKLISSHRMAVNEAMKVLEQRYSSYRGGTKDKRTVEVSGKFIAAQFEHDSTRKKDPELHTHNVVMSLMQDKSGEWKAFHNDRLHTDSKYGGLIYQNVLAKEAMRLGYEIIDHGNGTFDLRGFSKEQRDVYSKRRQQLEEMGVKTQKDARTKVMIDRDAKGPEIPREELRKIWIAEGAAVDLRKISPKEKSVKTPKRDIDQAVSQSIQQAVERNVSFRKTDIERIVMENNLGFFQFEAITKAVERQVDKTIFPATEPGRYVSLYSLQIENEYRSLAKDLKGRYVPLMTAEQAMQTVNEVSDRALVHSKVMTSGQKAAIQNTLTGIDGLSIWQGVAGSGKTDSMKPVVEVLRQNGYEVFGFAPSASAAKSLSDGAGIKAKTLQSLIVSKPEPPGKGEKPLVWVVDEAGFISAKDMLALLKHQKVTGARIILTGDKRQKSAVEAGNPLLDLQKNEHGLQVSELNESVRQKTRQLKEAVAYMNQGDIEKGLQHIENKIVEVRDSTRSKEVAKYYLSLPPEQREKAIVVARTNLERYDITEKIRDGLKEEGKLGKRAEMSIYEKVDVFTARRGYAAALAVGDLIVPIKNDKSAGLDKGKSYEIVERNTLANTIVLQDTQNRLKLSVVDLRSNNEYSVFKPKELTIYEGDRLAWTRNQHGEARINNDMVRIDRIEGKTVEVTYESGRKEKISLNDRHFLDQAWVLTTDKSQGLSRSVAIISADKGKKKESLYVDVTRAVDDVRIFCESKEQLYSQAKKSEANQIATDLVADLERMMSKLETPSLTVAREPGRAKTSDRSWVQRVFGGLPLASRDDSPKSSNDQDKDRSRESEVEEEYDFDI